MNYHRKRGWDMPASAITPEAIFLGRREFLAGAGALGASLGFSRYVFADEGNPYPAKRNDKYKLDREITPEATNLNYNNFYEFSTSKHINADALKIRPWTVKIDGLVEQEADVRRRRADQGDRPRGAALSPSLRRSMVDGDSLDRLPVARAGGKGAPAFLGEIRSLRELPRQEDGPGSALVHALALCRGADNGGSDERSRLRRHRRLRQADRESAGRADFGSPRRGNMASSQQSRSFASALSPTGRRRSGRILVPTNTASGRTSIRKFPIRDGARRRRRN